MGQVRLCERGDWVAKERAMAWPARRRRAMRIRAKTMAQTGSVMAAAAATRRDWSESEAGVISRPPILPMEKTVRASVATTGDVGLLKDGELLQGEGQGDGRRMR